MLAGELMVGGFLGDAGHRFETLFDRFGLFLGFSAGDLLLKAFGICKPQCRVCGFVIAVARF